MPINNYNQIPSYSGICNSIFMLIDISVHLRDETILWELNTCTKCVLIKFPTLHFFLYTHYHFSLLISCALFFGNPLSIGGAVCMCKHVGPSTGPWPIFQEPQHEEHILSLPEDLSIANNFSATGSAFLHPCCYFGCLLLWTYCACSHICMGSCVTGFSWPANTVSAARTHYFCLLNIFLTKLFFKTSPEIPIQTQASCFLLGALRTEPARLER